MTKFIYLHKLESGFSVIPLGLIRDAHFTRNVPKYLNVGSLGLTLAHEILHSLDRMGRGFRYNHRNRLEDTCRRDGRFIFS
jgi:predicted metalloendopeptidase